MYVSVPFHDLQVPPAKITYFLNLSNNGSLPAKLSCLQPRRLLCFFYVKTCSLEFKTVISSFVCNKPVNGSYCFFYAY